MAETLIVVPCFNEAERLRLEAFSAHLERDPETDFILVNDGSHDQTLSLIESLAAENPQRVTVIDQKPNVGKAEAVRLGLQQAFDLGCRHVGYFDADLATPLDEILSMRRILEQQAEIEMVFGARIQLMGRHIERNRVRHYLGRVFATIASEILQLSIYDTQCGAKLFRNNQTTRTLFSEPFKSHWIFDVEILARRIALTRFYGLPDTKDVVYEMPLETWIDVEGSKVGPSDFFRASLALNRIRRRYLRPTSAPWPTSRPTETE